MSALERLALGCVLAGFEGLTPPDWVGRRAEAGLGGVVLFGRNIRSRGQVRRLTDALHAERADLVVAIDEEGGDVTRLDAGTGSPYPGNLALGAAGDPRLTEAVAAAIGAELRQCGIDLNLAPVADVNVDPRNPVIGVRSFGSDATAAARHTAAWVSGLQGAGVAACAKHFPGHGDTSADSHLELPVAGEDPRLRALEPFKAAIESGVRAIMSAHIVAPELDSQAATTSPRIMTRLLRDELGFEGVAVSDGLDMAALSGGRGIPEAAVLAIAAGCDMLVVGGGPRDADAVDAIVAAIVEAVESGRLSEARLAQAASRRRRIGPPPVTSTQAGQEGIGLVAARRAACAEGDVKLRGAATVLHLDSPGSIAAGEVPWGVGPALAARGVALTDTGRVVIEVRDLHRRPEHVAAVDALLERHGDAILVEMGVPVLRPRLATAYIATHGSARVCAEAAAELMTAGAQA